MSENIVFTTLTVSELSDMNTPNTNIEYLTRKETSEVLKITLSTLNDYTKRGIIKGVRIGKGIRYKKQDIYKSLEEIKTIKYKRNG